MLGWKEKEPPLVGYITEVASVFHHNKSFWTKLATRRKFLDVYNREAFSNGHLFTRGNIKLSKKLLREVKELESSMKNINHSDSPNSLF